MQLQQNASLLAKNKMVVVSQTVYSPDLSPCDIFWFPRLNQDVKGRRFADVADVLRESLAVFDFSVEDFT
jgi:hypothetical protein